MAGPLEGIRVIEVEGIGPCPFAGMMLADLGAEVIRVGRPQPSQLQAAFDLMSRGKKSILLDLKKPEGSAALLEVVKTADVLIEGFRPGVMERLGVGPEPCLAANPKLVFGRMTGWGQEGPYAHAAGHDINYIALAGALHAIGRKGERPTIPLNLVGDFGGGGLLLAFGVLAAVLETRKSGKGQVVDAAMVDGVAALMSSVYSGMQSGFWSHERGENLLDSGAAFYDTYETKDGKYVSIGSLEPQFYAELIQRLEIEGAPAPMEHLQPAKWNELRPKLEAAFKSRTRDEWCKALEGTDVCFAPVLTAHEVFEHPHHVARESFFTMDGVKQPMPAPRFSRTSPGAPKQANERGADTEQILRECGVTSGGE
ncbi:MAG: CaiB/BaiF CoA-transferase family protein [Myxococcota bacterium]